MRPDILPLKRAVEGPHVTGLLQRVLLDELVPYAQRLHGFSETAAAVLWTVVGPDPQVRDVLACRRDGLKDGLDRCLGGSRRVEQVCSHRLVNTSKMLKQ